MSFNVGISGATGVTGEVALRILEARNFPVRQLRLFASKRSAGQTLRWRESDYQIEALEEAAFDGLDLIISATSASIARSIVPKMVAAGAIVIDQSSAFRLDSGVPLVVPEINGVDLQSHNGIIAGPNCTTAVAVMAIAPLHEAFEAQNIVSSSYQAMSGKGREGMKEFLAASQAALGQSEGLRGHETLNLPDPVQFPHYSAFNLFPHCEQFETGSDMSTEEAKMEAEMRKMLHAPNLMVHATAVRVPVLVGHTVSLSAGFKQPVSPSQARQVLQAFPGLSVLDEPQAGIYPTPLAASGIDEVLVGRIRTVPFFKNGLSLVASGDNLRKGNALNAIQVAEQVLGIKQN